MGDPIVYGPAYSTYTRSVRMALAEKSLSYKLVEVDVLKGEGERPEHLRRHPFGKVPAFEHDGFALYETAAINHYIDDVLAGPKLTPVDHMRKARMNQIIGLIDSYLYQPAIHGVFIPRVIGPMMGETADELKVAEKAATADKALGEIERLAGSNTFLAGPSVSLADVHLAPVIAYYSQTPEGEQALKKHPKLAAWWSRVKDRPSFKSTAPKL